MKVLISGATGFIGRYLAERLIDTDHEVHGLTRDPARASRSQPRVRFHAWEQGTPVDPSLVAGVDAIVNLAGESVNGRWSADKKARIMDSRVQGTRAIVEAMTAAGAPGVLVNASAVGVYGDRGDELLTEASAPGQGFLKDVVLRWEDEALAAERRGARVALMRFGIVLGADGGAMEKLLPLAKLGINGPLGSGKQWWPWVHIDDLVRAIEFAMRPDMSGVYNVTAPHPVTQREFSSVLGRVVKRPAFLPAPGFALRFAQGEFADELLFSKRVLPRRLLDAGFRFEYPELEGALRQLLGREAMIENVPAHA